MKLAQGLCLVAEGDSISPYHVIQVLKSLTNAYFSLSFDEEMYKMSWEDTLLLIYSFILMFIYANVTLGKLNKVESRFFISIAGMLSIIMGLVVGIAICHLLGYTYFATYQIAFVICLGKPIFYLS